MAFTIAQQFHETVRRAQRVLFALREHPTVDEVMAALALRELLATRQTEVTVVSTGFVPTTALRHAYPEIQHIVSSVGALHELEVRIAVPDALRARTKLTPEQDALVLRVTPPFGTLGSSAVHTSVHPFRFDLMVAFGAPDRASLGSLYTNNVALFEQVPMINIDVSPRNEFFGQINCVDITQSSVCELLFTLLETHADMVNERMAHLFLTGIISATQSFKTHLVQARTLQTASQLIAFGADREQIMQHLYRQRSVATLRLWGAALSHTESDVQQPLVWTSLTRDDFTRAGASVADLHDLCDELVHTCPHARVFVLGYENPVTGATSALVDTQHPYEAAHLVSGFVGAALAPHVHRMTVPLANATLAEGLQKVLNVIRSKMKR